MTLAEATVLGLAVALLAFVRLSADLAGSRIGALLATLALLATAAVVIVCTIVPSRASSGPKRSSAASCVAGSVAMAAPG